MEGRGQDTPDAHLGGFEPEQIINKQLVAILNDYNRLSGYAE
jgi:hypothetical protein